MKVESGSVGVKQIREKKTHVFTTAEGYTIRFTKLKESWVIRKDGKVEIFGKKSRVIEPRDRIVEINGKDNQEIEVWSPMIF